MVPLYFFFFSLGSGIAAGVSALTARAIGARDARMRRTVMASGLLLALGIAALCLLAGLPFINDIVRLLAGSRMGGAAMEYGARYFLFTLPGLALLLVGQVFLGTFQGEGRTQPIAVATAISTAANIGLAPLLMFVLHMGVAGAGLATSLSIAIAGVYVMAASARDRSGDGPWIDLRAARRRVAGELSAIGFPQTVGLISLSVTVLLLNKVVGGIGEREMGSWSLVTRIDQMVSVPVVALAAATLTIAGQNRGRGLAERIRRVNTVNILCGVGVMLALAAAYSLLAPLIFGAFSTSAAVVNGSVAQVRATSFAFAGTAAAAVAGSTMMGVGRPLPALGMAAVRAGLPAVPLALVLSAALGWGISGVFAAVAAANFAGLPIAWLWSRAVLGEGPAHGHGTTRS